MRAVVLALGLVLGLLAPPAHAAFCAGGVCVADEPYRDAEPGCNGTRWVTGAWFSTQDVFVYAMGETHDCAYGWSGMGGEGIRVGFFLVAFDGEARWYDRASGGCEAGVFSMGFHAAGPCLVPPPSLPWGRALP